MHWERRCGGGGVLGSVRSVGVFFIGPGLGAVR